VIDLRLGDCMKVGPDLSSIDAIVSDPPYGVRRLNGRKLRSNYTRFTGGSKKSESKDHREIEGDDRAFEPATLLAVPKVILFGMNCYSDKLPPGSVLVWCKKPASKLGKFLGDCELAWMKGGHGVYLFHHVWDGVCRDTEVGQHLHPSQKPVALMRWCIGKLKLKPGSTILDPYMGSGSTGVAAVELGFNFVGIEVDPDYLKSARRRINAALRRSEAA
jgi:site-specific DNA-methyltransferase (adenine-specific)